MRIAFVTTLALTGCSLFESPNPIRRDEPMHLADGGVLLPDGGVVSPDAAVLQPDGAAPSPMGGPTAGSRLKPKFFTGEDGSKVYVPGTMVDTMRNDDCTFIVAGDGQTRCLPASTFALYFSDSGCSQPIGQQLKGCSTPKYASRADGVACYGATAVHLRIYTIASPYSGKVFGGTPGSCTDVTSSLGPSYDFYVLGAEISPSSFVAGTGGQDP
jgi:hypothetical protein